MNSPSFALRLTAEERDELHALARKAGVSLSSAFRRGARLYLLAITDEHTMKIGRPPKTAKGESAAS